jgi:hypothetical protein
MSATQSRAGPYLGAASLLALARNYETGPQDSYFDWHDQRQRQLRNQAVLSRVGTGPLAESRY